MNSCCSVSFCLTCRPEIFNPSSNILTSTVLNIQKYRFSLTRALLCQDTTILYLYGRRRVIENSYSCILYAVQRCSSCNSKKFRILLIKKETHFQLTSFCAMIGNVDIMLQYWGISALSQLERIVAAFNGSLWNGYFEKFHKIYRKHCTKNRNFI